MILYLAPCFLRSLRLALLRICLLLLAVLGSVTPVVAGNPELPSVVQGDSSAPTSAFTSAERHVRAQRWERAIEALEKVTVAEPQNGMGWFYLAYSLHNSEQLKRAVEVGAKATEFPEVRSIAFYNMACGFSLLGNVQQAKECLEQCGQSGYLDYDLVESDEELANLREAVELVLPARYEYTTLRGRNGVEIPYVILRPEDFDPTAEVSVLVAFAPGAGGRRSTDWTIDRYWGAKQVPKDWVIVCAVSPKDGWINHPSHHALEDLFKLLRKDLEVKGNSFHLVGVENGARVATTYSRMSKAYTASLTTISGRSFRDWDRGDFRSMRKLPVHQWVGAAAANQLASARIAQSKLLEQDVAAELTLLPGEGPCLQSLSLSQLTHQLVPEGE
ncbi:MAG: tetratricopeptide (TPR) repeat protein [Planctomycetota bacterium]|jgi:tetratricopeptide (TPR) repeat protein